MRRLLITLPLVAGILAAGYVGHLWQQDLRAKRPMLPVTFAHLDHRSVNCVDCHHNFVDHTGQGLCFDCHKTDPAVNAMIEDQFHDLCRGCHEDRQRDGEESGPTRQCIDCHTADEAP
jgi:hypothetical protein